MRRFRFVGIRIVLFGIVAVTITGFVVAGLWNSLMPAIFNLPAISFWQALGLLLLSRVLFGRLGGWGSKMSKARFCRGWKDLTPEERERFRSAMNPHRTGEAAEKA